MKHDAQYKLNPHICLQLSFLFIFEMETSDRLEVCVGLLLLLLLLLLLGKEYRIYSIEEGGKVTKVTNPAPNMIKCLHEEVL